MRPVVVSLIVFSVLSIASVAGADSLFRPGGGSGGGTGGGGAPTDATYLTTTADPTLSNEVPIGVADDTVIVGNGTTWQAKPIPSCSNSSTDKVLYNSTTNTFSCGADQNSGGTPAVVAPSVVTVNAGNSPYTVLSTDYLIVCDTTLAARVVNLHAATTNHIIAVSNLGANTCTINRNGSDTIVGDTVVILSAQHDGVTMIADGSSRWTLH